MQASFRECCQEVKGIVKKYLSLEKWKTRLSAERESVAKNIRDNEVGDLKTIK